MLAKSTENSFDPAVWAVAATLGGAIVYLVLALKAVNMAPLSRTEHTSRSPRGLLGSDRRIIDQGEDCARRGDAA